MGVNLPLPASDTFMNNQKSGMAPAIFAGMCVVLCLWAAVTIYLEARLGWPADRVAWGHRAIGWFINLVLMRTFIKGMQRYYTLRTR